MADTNTYHVTVALEPEGPDPLLAQRFAVIAAFRLSSLERRTGHYPVTGAHFDMLDGLEGKYLWEMSDEELAAKPPTRVDFEVLGVDPAERPSSPTQVHVTVRVPT